MCHCLWAKRINMATSRECTNELFCCFCLSQALISTWQNYYLAKLNCGALGGWEGCGCLLLVHLERLDWCIIAILSELERTKSCVFNIIKQFLLWISLLRNGSAMDLSVEYCIIQLIINNSFLILTVMLFLL